MILSASRVALSTSLLLIALVLPACGGGGGDGVAAGTGGGASMPATVSGFVVKGPTRGATVELLAIDPHK